MTLSVSDSSVHHLNRLYPELMLFHPYIEKPFRQIGGRPCLIFILLWKFVLMGPETVIGRWVDAILLTEFE